MSSEAKGVRDFLAIAARRQRLVLKFVAACTLSTALGVYLLPPTYKTAATFLVQRDRPPTLTQISQPNWLVDRNEVIQTEVALLKSDSVLGRAVDIAGLVGRPKSPKILPRIKRGLVQALKTSGLLYPAPERDEWIDWIESHIKVKPVVQSDVITLTVDGDDPQLVGEIGRALSLAYRERHAEVFRNQDVFGFYQAQLTASSEALKRLKERQAELKTQLDVSSFEEQRSAFLVQKARIEERRRALRDAQPRLLAASRTLLEHPETPASLVTVPVTISEQFAALVDQQKSVADAEQKRDALLQQFREPADPKIVAATERLAARRAALAQSMVLAAQEVKTRLASLDATGHAVESQVEEFNKKERLLTELSVEIESTEQRYKRYAERLEDVRANANTERPVVNVALIDEATTPSRPWLPRIVFIMLALVLSSVLGIGVAILAESADAALHAPEDAERRVGIPVLAVIPLHEDAPPRGAGGERR